MRVYVQENGVRRLVGRADLPADTGPVHREHLFGPGSTIIEEFVVTGIPSHDADGGSREERVVLLSPGQRPELLPGWVPLSS